MAPLSMAPLATGPAIGLGPATGMRTTDTSGFGRYASGLTAMVVGDAVELPVMGASLPAVCCKCGTNRDLVPRSERLVYTPPATYVLAVMLAVFGLLFTILALRAGQKTIEMVFPVCPDCDARWRNAKIVRVASMLLPFGIGILVGVLAPNDGSNILVGLGAFLLSLIALPLAAQALVVKPATVVVTRIDNVRARLVGFSPPALDAIREVSGPAGTVWAPSSGGLGAILVLAAIPIAGILLIVAILGVRSFIANAKLARNGGAADAATTEPLSGEHAAEVEAAYARCLGAADDKAKIAELGAGGDPRRLESIADTRRIARFGCADLKRDCGRSYYGISCQAALR